MSGLSPTSLIALQSYGAADAARRQHQPQRDPQAQQQRFAIEDNVTLRAPEPAKKTRETKEPDETRRASPDRREDGVGRREAVNPERPAYKRPGSLVDVKA